MEKSKGLDRRHFMKMAALAAGAAAVMTPGTELCRREDAERLFGSMVSGSE